MFLLMVIVMMILLLLLSQVKDLMIDGFLILVVLFMSYLIDIGSPHMSMFKGEWYT